MKDRASPAATSRRGTLLLSVFGLLLMLGFVAFHLMAPTPALEATLTAKAVPHQGFRLYLASKDGRYKEQQAADLERGVASDGGLAEYRARIVTRDPAVVFRLDPDPKQTQAEIRSLDLRTRAGNQHLSGQDLMALCPLSHDLSLSVVGGTSGTDAAGMLVQISGNDPYLNCNIPQGIRDHDSVFRKSALRWLSPWWTPFAGLLVLLFAQHSLLLRGVAVFQGVLSRWSETLSQATTVRIGPGAILWLLVLPLLLSVYVGLKLHNSSIGMWADQYGNPLHQPVFDRGEPQEIRSDEWFVHTPWLLNQSQTGMKPFNPNMGPPGTPLVAGVPVLHPTLIAHPQFWGYLMFDIERGFSWHWGVRAVSLLGALFTLFLLFTRGQTLLAWAGALAIFGSSQVQWWYASWLTEIIAGMSGALVGLFLWSNSPSRKVAYGAGILAALCGMHVVQHPYLPALMSMAFLGVFLGSAIVWDSHRSGALTRLGTHRWLALGVGLAFFSALFWSFYDTAKPAIDTMLNTTYPGKRVVTGGDLAWTDELVGWFDFWRDKFETPLPTNPSEAARPLLLYPFVALLAIWSVRKGNSGAVFWSLLAYCFMAAIWMHVPLPAPWEQWFGRIGLNKIPSFRMYGGLGVASWFMTVLVLATVAEQPNASRPPRRVAVAVALLAVAAVFLAWKALTPLNPSYYTVERMMVASLVIAPMLWAVVRGNRFIFLMAVLLVTWKPLLVNPTSTGLSRLLDKEISHRAKALDPEGKEKWVVMRPSALSQLLRANGHQVISGNYFAPRFDLMHHFDPEERHLAWWNNYGEVHFEAISDPRRIDFHLNGGEEDPDVIRISPCNSAFQALGITRVVMHKRADLSLYPCLRQLAEFEPISVFIYDRLPG